MEKRAIIYARVSSPLQAKEGYSLDNQVKMGKQVCDREGFQIVDIFQDIASGADLDRYGLYQARTMLFQGLADIVIVYSSDRLSRSFVHSCIIFEEIRKYGAELYFVSESMVGDIRNTQIFSNIEGILNEYWRKRMMENAHNGRRGKAHRGQVVITHTAPYGYKLSEDNTMLEIDEKEAEIVKLIYRLCIYGNGENPLSLTAIADHLANLQVSTPNQRGHNPSGFKTNRLPYSWNESSIRNILISETYTGVWFYGKTHRIDGKIYNKNREDWIAVSVPAIISVEEQQEVIYKLSSKRNIRRGYNKEQYILRGRIKCDKCGLSYIGMHAHYKLSNGEMKLFRYYRCNGSQRKTSLNRDKIRCDMLTINANETEDKIWNWIINALQDQQNIKNCIEILAGKQNIKLTLLMNQLNIINDILDKIAKKRRQWISISEMDGIDLDMQEVKDRLRIFEFENEEFLTEKSKTISLIENIQGSYSDINVIETATQQICAGITDFDFDLKARILNALMVRGIVYKIDGKRKPVVSFSSLLLQTNLVIEGVDFRRSSQK